MRVTATIGLHSEKCDRNTLPSSGEKRLERVSAVPTTDVMFNPGED